MSLFPTVTFESICRDTLNERLVAWEHRMGPCDRPIGLSLSHGLRHEGRLVAVVATDSLVRESCAGLSREEALELSRLCAERQDLCRVALRLWREFVFRPLTGTRPNLAWAISYQDEALHTGATYRNDGWVKLGRSSSGTDARSGRRGRRKTIWGWTYDAGLRNAARVR